MLLIGKTIDTERPKLRHSLAGSIETQFSGEPNPRTLRRKR
jgi:hypothetical protein